MSDYIIGPPVFCDCCGQQMCTPSGISTDDCEACGAMSLADATEAMRELAGAIERVRTAKAPEAYVRQAQMYQMGFAATEVGPDCRHRIATTAMHAWLEQAQEGGK